MTNRSNLFRDADSRARLLESQRPPTLTRRQRTHLDRTLRRLGWHTRPKATR